MSGTKWQPVDESDGLRTERLPVPGGHLYRVARLDYWGNECGFDVTFAPAKSAAVAARNRPAAKAKRS